MDAQPATCFKKGVLPVTGFVIVLGPAIREANMTCCTRHTSIAVIICH